MHSWLVAIALFGADFPNDAQQTTTPLSIKMRNGTSTLLHATDAGKLTFRTSFTTISMNLRHIRVLQFNDDHQTIVVSFPNGDRVTGVLEQDQLAVQTRQRSVTILLKDIDQIRITRRVERNLVRNGGFERPIVQGRWRMIGRDQDAGVTNWVVRNRSDSNHGRVDLVGTFWRGVSERNTAPQVDQSLELDYRVIVSQDIPTEPGKPYVVSFWYSHNPDSGHSRSGAILRVRGKNQQLHRHLIHSLNSSFANMRFQFFGARFVADHDTTTIEFEDTTNGPMGFVLDDVCVYEVDLRDSQSKLEKR